MLDGRGQPRGVGRPLRGAPRSLAIEPPLQKLAEIDRQRLDHCHISGKPTGLTVEARLSSQVSPYRATSKRPFLVPGVGKNGPFRNRPRVRGPPTNPRSFRCGLHDPLRGRPSEVLKAQRWLALKVELYFPFQAPCSEDPTRIMLGVGTTGDQNVEGFIPLSIGDSERGDVGLPGGGKTVWFDEDVMNCHSVS